MKQAKKRKKKFEDTKGDDNRRTDNTMTKRKTGKQ